MATMMRSGGVLACGHSTGLGARPIRLVARLARLGVLRHVAAAAAAEVSVSEQPPTPSSSSAAAPGPAAPRVNEDFKGDMLKPAAINTPWARAAAVMAAVALAAGSTVVMPARLGAFLHVSAYAVWLGSQLWNTFFVGLTLFKNLPRQTFGRVQSKLFPAYFTLTAGANLLALGTLALGGAATTPQGVNALVALAVGLATTAANWVWLEPVCTKLMFERYDLENLEVKTDDVKDKVAALYKEFGKWHGISSLLNLVGFCVAIAHGWYLASLLTL